MLFTSPSLFSLGLRRYDLCCGTSHALASPQELPPTVAAAGVGMLELGTVEDFAGGASRSARAAAQQQAQQRQSYVWVGCVPTVSSEVSAEMS